MLVNEDGQYTIWPGDFTVPSGWRTAFGPAGRAECRRYVEREWRAPGLGMGPGGPGRAVGGGARNAGRRGLADTVHGLVRARAAHDPDAVAVVTDEETLTYRELDTRSDRLAGVLRGLGVGPERVVPVCLERGADLVTALLGVLKAGGAFLPLDPAHPRRRLARLVEDCGADVVVSADGRPFPGVRAVVPDGGADATVEAGPGEDPAGPDDLAYLIYTSGTTGTPKGVPVTHRSLVFTLDRVVHAYGLTARDRVLQLAALGFDTSLEQVFATLAAGATLVLGGARTWAPTELAHRMRELRLTVADLTPAYWHHLLGLFPPGGPAPEGLRLIIVGGDTVHADDCRACLERLPGVRLVNAYGVTEAAVTSTLCELTPEVLEPGAQHAGPAHPSAAPVPIGRPLPGVRVHLLDARLSPVPPGEKGEIHLGGPGLARGYWRAPGLTAETFLPDPYAPVPGERMYRTGDAGRWRADGNLEILGRFDDQLKVRGHRVDPAEVESVLAAHPDVRQARVAAEGSADGSRGLIAYYTLTERAASGAHARRGRIRAYLAERLPDFMVPADFVLLDSMPLTAAGKIDRRRLPDARPQLQRRDGQEAAGGGDPTGARRAGAGGGAGSPNGSAPNGSTPAGGTVSVVEAGVAQLWSELLGVEEVGPDDDFFDLGGNSLLAMEMLARARIMFGIDVTRIRFLTRSLLRDATLRAFAADTLAARTGGPAWPPATATAARSTAARSTPAARPPSTGPPKPAWTHPSGSPGAPRRPAPNPPRSSSPAPPASAAPTCSTPCCTPPPPASTAWSAPPTRNTPWNASAPPSSASSARTSPTAASSRSSATSPNPCSASPSSASNTSPTPWTPSTTSAAWSTSSTPTTNCAAPTSTAPARSSGSPDTRAASPSTTCPPSPWWRASARPASPRSPNGPRSTTPTGSPSATSRANGSPNSSSTTPPRPGCRSPCCAPTTSPATCAPAS